MGIEMNHRQRELAAKPTRKGRLACTRVSDHHNAIHLPHHRRSQIDLIRPRREITQFEPLMELREFAEYHSPALERDEARYNLMLGLLVRLLNSAPNQDVRLWTLGASGQCAMQTSPRNAIILGKLDEGQCRAFADETLGLQYPGVIGSDPIVFWFVQRALERGVKFLEPIPQQRS